MATANDYNGLAKSIWSKLDALHVDLINLQNMGEVSGAAVNLANDITTIHGDIETARAIFLQQASNGGNGKAALTAAGFTVYDWQAEWQARAASR